MASVGVAFLVCMVYMILLRLFAGLMVFLTILSYLGGLGALGYVLYQKGITGSTTGTDLSYFVYIGYAVWALTAISAVFFCCYRDALKLAVAVVKSAGLFLMDCKTVLFVPIIGQLLFIAVFALWFFGFIIIYSNGTPSKVS